MEIQAFGREISGVNPEVTYSIVWTFLSTEGQWHIQRKPVSEQLKIFNMFRSVTKLSSAVRQNLPANKNLLKW